MVFDTMVLAYALLRTPEFWQDSLKALYQADEILVPDLFRAEFLNVVWQWVLVRNAPMEFAREVLADAERLVTRVVPSNQLWENALDLAVARRHSPYDMLFVALAAETGSRLVTYDRRLQQLCPENVISVPEFLRQ